MLRCYLQVVVLSAARTIIARPMLYRTCGAMSSACIHSSSPDSRSADERSTLFPRFFRRPHGRLQSIIVSLLLLMSTLETLLPLLPSPSLLLPPPPHSFSCHHSWVSQVVRI